MREDFTLQMVIRLYPVSIPHKSIAGRYRPVRVADGPITARCRFIKNASWVLNKQKVKDKQKVDSKAGGHRKASWHFNEIRWEASRNNKWAYVKTLGLFTSKTYCPFLSHILGKVTSLSPIPVWVWVHTKLISVIISNNLRLCLKKSELNLIPIKLEFYQNHVISAPHGPLAKACYPI